ncbi:MAG TPA: Wzz/FepE/Etk N-terminal domain-containing protein [Terriglobia bacterium]|nr:Wzz/FepE/Etk N-terminal domain-containing protein [Terriglobia bacterium]
MRKQHDEQSDLRGATTLGDWAAIGFRQRRLIAITFLALFTGVLFVSSMMPRQYEAETKILVKRERVDPLVTPEQTTQTVAPDFTEQDVNSEVELLRSRDLLEKVAISSGLVSQDKLGLFYATRNLDRNLTIEPLKKTKLIRITYRSGSTLQSRKVLETLTDLYLQKHLEVHRPPGALEFFQARAEEYRKGLANAEHQLADFGTRNGVVDAQLEKDITVRKLSEFESGLRQTQAVIAETQQRIRALEREKSSTPERLTTAVKTSDNPLLLQQLRSTLLNLELKRTELLSKFAPGYRPVQEVEAQIAQTREALANVSNNQVREETTDRDTTHEWLNGELAKARAELSALEGRMLATTQIVARYSDEARALNETAIAQEDLVRSAKTAEETYLLYARKQEEARISDALDRQRIVNVSIAEAASALPIPVGPGWPLKVLLAGLLAGFVSAGIALAADYRDRSFRTPDESDPQMPVSVGASMPFEVASGS